MVATILHSDLNNFYASVELKKHPELLGKPMAVCGSLKDRHGIVLAKSQEAKQFSIMTGETIGEAKKKCPHLIIVEPHFEEYLYYSQQVRKIYYDYTNLVEAFGLDECWLDVTHSSRLYGSGEEIAHQIRKRVKTELGLTVSIGISYNKIFAKMASDLKKPDAVIRINPEDIQDKVWKLPIETMLGIGKKTEEKLKYFQIFTLGDLAQVNPRFLKKILGAYGPMLQWNAQGKNQDAVQCHQLIQPCKSLSSGLTYAKDLTTDREVELALQNLAYELSSRLRKNALVCQGIQLLVKDKNLHTQTFQKYLTYTTLSAYLLTNEALGLFKERYTWSEEIRSLTLKVYQLKEKSIEAQLSFWNMQEELINLEDNLYQLREKLIDSTLFKGFPLSDFKDPQNKQRNFCSLPRVSEESYSF